MKKKLKKQNKDIGYLIHTWSDTSFKGTVVNRELPYLHEGLPENTLTVPWMWSLFSMTTWLGLGVTATLLDTLLVCQDPLAEMEGITTVMLTTLEVNGNFSTYHLTFWLFDNFMFHPVRIRKVWNVSDMPMSNIKSPELFTRHLRHPNFCQCKRFLGEDDL